MEPVFSAYRYKCPKCGGIMLYKTWSDDSNNYAVYECFDCSYKKDVSNKKTLDRKS